MSEQYSEPKEILIKSSIYQIRSLTEIDQIFYDISKEGHLQFVLSINHDGEWEANCDIDKDLAREIGERIKALEL